MAALRRLFSRTGRDVSLFAALAAAILLFQFRDAVLHGYVLGQADLLYQFEPWQAHAPGRVRLLNPLIGDSPLVFYPFLAEARRAILSGRLPLWTAGIYAGHPFFASYQSALLSPFTAIAYVIPLPQATTVIAAARLATGAAGMWMFLRALGLGAPAMLFGALAYLLNPFSYVWLEHPLSAVSSWTPWLLYGVHRAANGARARDAVVLAVITALVLLAGHPETAFKVMLFAGAYAIVAVVRSAHRAGGAAMLATGLAVGLALAAVQILPFLEYLRESRILASRSTLPQLVNPPHAFITAFVPDFFGNPRWGPYLRIDTNYCEQVGYPSIAVWILAAVALTRRADRALMAFFAGCTLLAGLIMYGTPVSRWAAAVLPPLRVAVLARFGVVSIASLIVMAAFGVQRLDDSRADAGPTARFAPQIAATIAAVAVAAIVIAFLGIERPLLTSGRYLQKAQHAAALCGWWTAGAVALVWAAVRVPPRIASAGLTALVTIELLVFADSFHPAVRKEIVYPPLPEVDVVRRDPSVFRVAGWNDGFPADVGLVYGVQDFRGYDGVGVNAYLDLLDLGFKNIGFTHSLVHFATPHLIDLLNIKYLIVPHDVAVPADRFTQVLDGPMRVFRNDRVLPRAFLVDRAVTLTGVEAKRAIRSNQYDVGRYAILERDLDAAMRPDSALAAVGTATITKYEDERIEIATDADGRRLLLLSDVFYPGWKATIDGARTPILRADLALRAVAVPAGRHAVQFVYAPASFKWGASISIATLAAAVSLLALVRRRK